MRTRILLLALFFFIAGTCGFAQKTDPYKAAWKRVDSLIEKGLPVSARKEVDKIYKRAVAEKSEPQWIRAIVYRSSLQERTRENNLLVSLQELEKEAAAMSPAGRSIIAGVRAEFAWQYFQRNRYQLYGRTPTTTYIRDSIETWSLTDFHRHISSLFLRSLEPKKLLQSIPVNNYSPLLIKGNSTRLRPTLYDLLANRALDYFTSGEYDLQRPAFAFVISDTAAFAPAASFATHKFSTRDTISLQHKALTIYQELIAFHLKDANPDALIDIDLQRLEFVYAHSVTENKQALYERALLAILKKYQAAQTTQSAYLLASLYNEQANSYDPHGDTTQRYSRLKARNILLAALRDSSTKNEGWHNSLQLLQQLEAPIFSFTIEEINVPGKPFRILVQYRNLPGMQFRILKKNARLQMDQYRDHEDYWKAVATEKPLIQWFQELPATNDLQSHSVEVPVTALAAGNYILVAAAEGSGKTLQRPVYAQNLFVSNISLLYRDSSWFVLHRETGQPLEGARIQPLERSYENERYVFKKKGDALITDRNGMFRYSGQQLRNYAPVNFLISYQGDTLDTRKETYLYYNQRNNQPAKEQRSIYFFTDRAIYRPGQTLHFKGILFLKQPGALAAIEPGYKTTVKLQNANGIAVDSITLTTNEFGSFSGKFTLPSGGLNGIYSIHCPGIDSYQSFRVEEYKRPKFYVELPAPKESYKVHDTIRISGKAMAYAGNLINRATVKWRVVRHSILPYWGYYGRFFPRTQTEIAFGTTITGEDGGFNFSFPALPDPALKPENDPHFQFVVSVDVTDENGETHSQSTQVLAGYKPILLNVQLPLRSGTDIGKVLQAITTNMAGEPLPATLTVKATKLLPEQRLIRPRLWQRPDQFILSKEDYIRSFPNDEYDNESDWQSWQRDGVVLTATDSSRKDGSWKGSPLILQPGFYEIEIISTDSKGFTAKDKKFIEVYQENDPKPSRPQYLWVDAKLQGIEPGEKDTVLLGTGATDVFLIAHTDRKGMAGYNFENISNNIRPYIFGATEADRGGYGIGFFFVKHNRIFQWGNKLPVPWSNKELNIEFGSFRDVTTPGSTETWKVKISGYKGEQLATEMLASAYDASLDQFTPHQWQKPSPWPEYEQYRLWNSLWFQAAQSESWEKEYHPATFFQKIYDRFFYTDEMPGDMIYRNGMKQVRLRGLAKGEVVATAAAPMNEAVQDRDASMGAQADTIATDKASPNEFPVTARKNFAETAFFFPDLQTGKDGSIEFSFTLPEALTRWKMQLLAHTKQGAAGLNSKELITQKDLMVQPNPPRFLRQGDRFEFTSKIVNLTKNELTGQAQLELIDAATGKPVDGWFQNIFPNQYFTVPAGSTEVVRFPIEIPYLFTNMLTWRITARAGNFSDGEEATLPVLSSKELITESMPLFMKGSGTKNYVFESLKQSATSGTLQHQAVTVEYSSNPAWYAVQALPFLSEYPYDCAEQVWNRYYSGALAAHILHSIPRMAKILQSWQADTTALLSALEKNPELKNALLEETPWVLQAGSESAQKKALMQLFNLEGLRARSENLLSKLEGMQLPSGAFPWFKGGRDDRYITQYILAGMGHLEKLGAVPPADRKKLQGFETRMLRWLDRMLKDDYDAEMKRKPQPNTIVPAVPVYYLYARSFFSPPADDKMNTVINYYLKAVRANWTKQSTYTQAMIALTLHRNGDKAIPAAILRSMKETSVNREEQGRFWIQNTRGRSPYWYSAPIETQALVIEAFMDIAKDIQTADELKTWLLREKQTQNWRTTRATAEACYALLLQGSNWLAQTPSVSLKLGSVTLRSTDLKTEEATGYFKSTVAPQFVNPELSNITVQVNNTATPTQPSWGAVYWQYFEEVDKVKSAGSGMSLTKKIYRENMTDRGPLLEPITESSALKVGDKLVVRMELRSDRNMEYVHLKDQRASNLEPVETLSGYQWKNALGYYLSPRDASMNYFISYLPKGTHVIEYRLFVTHAGQFSGGLARVQCMYAPEFNAHSSAQLIKVE